MTFVSNQIISAINSTEVIYPVERTKDQFNLTILAMALSSRRTVKNQTLLQRLNNPHIRIDGIAS